MFNQYQPVPLIRPFEEVYQYIDHDAKPLNFLLPKIEKLEKQLLADKNRGHIDDDKLNSIKSHLLTAVQATNQLDLGTTKEVLNAAKKECSYRRIIRSRWALVGAAIGAVFEVAAITVATFITKGLVLPVIPWNALFASSFLGAWFGHKVGQWQAKRKITKINDSINSFFKNRGINSDIPPNTPQDFSTDESLKPANIYEVAAKLAAIHYQNLTITLEDVTRVFSEYLEATKKSLTALNNEFIKTLLNAPQDKGRFLFKSLLPNNPEAFLNEAINALNRKEKTLRV